MRLDKYLKVSRLIKRRTIAEELCSAGKVIVNGSPKKASYKVKKGDEIEIIFGQKKISIEVTSITEVKNKDEATGLYRFL